MIIESKAHARQAALKRPEKLEMVEWMLVWLMIRACSKRGCAYLPASEPAQTLSRQTKTDRPI